MALARAELKLALSESRTALGKWGRTALMVWLALALLQITALLVCSSPLLFAAFPAVNVVLALGVSFALTALCTLLSLRSHRRKRATSSVPPPPLASSVEVPR